MTTCFECGVGTLMPAEVELEGSRNGESFLVATHGLRCGNCGFQTVDSKDGAEFTRRVSDAYRSKHGLLTSAEIRARREQLKMTQQQFSEYLGPGIASVKRWESGQVQERAMDELIRLKTDPDAARRNLEALELKVPEQCVLSSAIVDGQEVELSFLLNHRQYETRPAMSADWSELMGMRGDEVALAA